MVLEARVDLSRHGRARGLGILPCGPLKRRLTEVLLRFHKPGWIAETEEAYAVTRTKKLIDTADAIIAEMIEGTLGA